MKYLASLFATTLIGLLALSPAWANTDKLAQSVVIDEADIDRGNGRQVVSYASSLSKARPAVVSVTSKRIVKTLPSQFSNPFFREFFGDRLPEQEREMRGLGSGVIVSKDGYILTNNHVIEGADEVLVRLHDDREFDAKIVGTDPQTDIAVLKIEAENLPAIVIANSDNLQVGDVVFAIGNPLGLGQTATMGIVSATGRNNLNLIDRGYENFIQTDAAINRGNSGGALTDAEGRLVGINTMIITEGRSAGNIGIGFAVPVNLAYSVMSSLVETGTVSRGFLGVGIQNLTTELAEGFGLDSTKGALITEVNPGTPAEDAGLQSGDVIVAVNGQTVDSPSDLRLRIAGKSPGTEVEITYIRDGERQSKSVVLAELSASARAPNEFLEGIAISNLNDELRQRYGIKEGLEGVVITGVAPGSPHATSLPEGMVILKVNGTSVSSVEEAKAAIRKGEKNMLLVVFRGVYRWVSVMDE